MEGDDFVAAASAVKKVIQNSDNRSSAIKERFDDLNNIHQNRDWITSLYSSLNPYTWLALLKGHDDHKLKDICGSDGALYIVYLRYCAYFFTLLSMGNGVLVYIYLNGEAKDLPSVM
jgi:hypothetical protein